MFICINSDFISAQIASANHLVGLITPCTTKEICDQLLAAHSRGVKVRVFLDCSDRTSRAGYGEVKGLRQLVEAGVTVAHSPGLRVGVLAVDDSAWSFNSIAQSVENVPGKDSSPNGFHLSRLQARELFNYIFEASNLFEGEPQTLPGLGSISGLGALLGKPLTIAQVAEVELGLELAPPLAFDLQRQVNVFQPYIRYVELKLEGASLARHKVALPADLAPLAKRAAVQQRLTTSYDLISKSAKIENAKLENQIKSIRKGFCRSVPVLGGSVILRAKEAEIKQKIKSLEAEIETYKATLKHSLEKDLRKSQADLVRELLPIVRRRPPERLINGCIGSKPKPEEARRWLEHELSLAFPSVEKICTNIKLTVIFKDVTFESLNKPELESQLQAAFPAISWEKAFSEFRAVEEVAQAAPHCSR